MDYAKMVLESVRAQKSIKDRMMDAIKKHYEVEISYDANDNNPKGKTTRIIQPVTYGLSKAGNEVLRAFQPYGDTETKIPSWKFFRLDRIGKWRTLWNRRFKEPPEFNKAEGKYNPNGDNSMSTVYLNAKFGENSNISKYNERRKKEKGTNDPYYKLKQNIKRSFNINDMESLSKNTNNRNKGNQSSISNMQTVNSFGDNKNAQTVGPQIKGQNEPETNNTNTPDYTQAIKNGPIYKMQQKYDDEQKQREIDAAWDEYYRNTDDDEEYDIDNNETEYGQ